MREEIKKELIKIINELKKEKKNLIGLQAPEGLKLELEEIIEFIENNNIKVITFLDECFGACDLKDDVGRAQGIDAMIHLGHNQFFKPKLKTFFIPIEFKIEKQKLERISKKIKKFIGKKKIVLSSTIQFQNNLNELKKSLEENGLKVLIGKGSERVNKGQVLGCDYSSVKNVKEKTNYVLFLGDGLFHAIGLAYYLKKPVIIVNPYNLEIKKLSEKEIKKREKLIQTMVGIARTKNSFGIIVSIKQGQNKLKEAIKLKELIEKKGKKAKLFLMDVVKPEYFKGLKIECLINSACPRIALDDFKEFEKPMINLKEAIKALKN